jgi:1-acyl-sn-glycerol-3-phosphate acyltransferase
VTEEDADLSALVAERLGSRKDRHRGLLFVRLERERKGECKKDYFTVRDRTDTDQGRHGSQPCFGPVPGRNGGSTTG